MDAALELPNLPLEDALQLVHLYFERGSPKAEPAARRWLVGYLSEGSPSLRDIAKVTASLAKRELEAGGMNQTLSTVAEAAEGPVETDRAAGCSRRRSVGHSTRTPSGSTVSRRRDVVPDPATPRSDSA